VAAPELKVACLVRAKFKMEEAMENLDDILGGATGQAPPSFLQHLLSVPPDCSREGEVPWREAGG
jgi:hypothetical protein